MSEKFGDKTLRSIFDEFTKEQKERVYHIIGRIIDDPSITYVQASRWDLSFLPYDYQKIMVLYLMQEACNSK